MKKVKVNLLLIASLLIPFILVFKAFFIPGSLAWGDAPFFYPKGLDQLFNLPFLWDFRNDNFGNPQSQFLWLYLPTFFMGLLHHFLGLNHEILIRLIFYFPATVFAIVGSWLFLGRWLKNPLDRLLGTILYSFNTYFLMIIDGGQVGMSLAYGLFPLVCFSLLNFFDKRNIRSFIFALLSGFILSNVDLRVFIITLIFTLIIQIFCFPQKTAKLFLKRTLIPYGFLCLSIVSLDLFWVIPLVLNKTLEPYQLIVNNNGFISLLNSLFLFHSHFPNNDFGKISSTPFYFVLLPLLIFSGLFFKREKKNILLFSLLFLIFAFLTKGGVEPGGFIYQWFIQTFPLGIAFRDSSKFFIPLILTASLLLGFSSKNILSIINNKKIQISVLVSIYFYLLFLIYPGLLGNLTGTLKTTQTTNNIDEINQTIQDDQKPFRTLWFEEKPPTAYTDWLKPAISANNLSIERPFASMITGKFDLFNFVHDPQFNQWCDLLGIKYLVFPGNERKKSVTKSDQTDWTQFLVFTKYLPNFKATNSYDGLLVLENDSINPHIFAQDKLILVLGGEEIYQKLLNSPNFSLANQGFVFIEDPKLDPQKLANIDGDSAILILENKTVDDLAMSFLRERMISLNKATTNQWMNRGSSDYLSWKYDLLKSNIDSREFDYGKGVAFSTVTGEKIKYQFSVPDSGKYYLATRYITASQSAGIKVEHGNLTKNLSNFPSTQFNWDVSDPIQIKKGKYEASLVNEGGFVMVNTMALIPDSEFKRAQSLANQLLNRFLVVQIKTDSDWGKLAPLLNQNFHQLSFNQVNPTEYRINGLPSQVHWLVFTDHYDSGWQLDKFKQNLNLPFYSMINGIYLDEKDLNNQKELVLLYQPQRMIKYGILFSLISAVLIILVISMIYIKQKAGKK